MSNTRDTKHAAAQGLKGPSGQLPHLERIQHAFGTHDVSGVPAHLGGQAREASRALGAEAYTSGGQVAFAGQPSLHVAAHEAAHIVQQRAGAVPQGGVGQRGDAYEKHADRVADRVVAGRSATDLLEPFAGSGGSGGSGGDGAVQMYSTEVTNGAKYRKSDNKKIAVHQASAEGGQMVHATQDRVDFANQKLLEAKSAIELTSGGAVANPDGEAMVSVEPKLRDTVVRGVDSDETKKIKEANKPVGPKPDDMGSVKNQLAIWTDCGRASRVVMGTMNDAPPHGLYKDGDKLHILHQAYDPGYWTNTVYLEGMKSFMRDNANREHLKNAGLMTKKTILLIFTRWEKNEPSTGAEAKQFWGQLDEAGKLAFAKHVGINEGVDPKIGEAYTMATGYDLPGFKYVNPDFTWNFHWAGVIMKDGADNLTLEGYAVMASEAQIAEVKKKYAYDPVKLQEELDKLADFYAKFISRSMWVCQMYGTEKADQTFHKQHKDTGTHGSEATTLTARR